MGISEKKKCSKCDETKPLVAFAEFLKRGKKKRRARCKPCINIDQANTRKKNPEQYREYDRKRGKTQERKEWKKKYGAAYDTAKPEVHRKSNKKWYYTNKPKKAAHGKLYNAMQRGEITKGLCGVCGAATVDGHHEDYSRPLEVIWLCRLHHVEHHKKRL